MVWAELGMVMMRSAVGSVMEKVVSKSLAVAPSNPMVLPAPSSKPVVAGVVVPMPTLPAVVHMPVPGRVTLPVKVGLADGALVLICVCMAEETPPT